MVEYGPALMWTLDSAEDERGQVMIAGDGENERIVLNYHLCWSFPSFVNEEKTTNTYLLLTRVNKKVNNSFTMRVTNSHDKRSSHASYWSFFVHYRIMKQYRGSKNLNQNQSELSTGWVRIQVTELHKTSTKMPKFSRNYQ